MTVATTTREALADDIVRVGEGDRAALRRVYDATSAKLFGVCVRMAGDHDIAEDALQDAYVKVWKGAHRFDRSLASPITWLCLIARGAAIDQRRSAGRRDQALAAIADHPGTHDADAIDPIVLQDCLGALEPAQREPILSAFFDGYRYGELAQRAAVPLATMKSRIRRALIALRTCLDG